MKRFLSITLCVMMLASLFAVNVSAAIPTTYEVLEGARDEIVYFAQDFSDASKTDFTQRGYDGAISVDEDGVLHMSGGYANCSTSATYSDSTIGGNGNYVFEFDFMRNDELTTDYMLNIEFNRAANASATNAILKNGYGVILPIRTVGMYEDENGVRWEDAINPEVDIEAKKWYNFRLTVTENDFVEAGGTTDNLRRLIKMERKLATESEWTTLTHSTYSHFAVNNARVNNSTLTAGFGSNEVLFVVGGDSYGQKAGSNAEAHVLNSETGEYIKDTSIKLPYDGRTMDFLVDNIKCYTPAVPGEMVEYDLPINQGVAFEDLPEVNLPAETGTKYKAMTIGWTSEPTEIVATFDAMIDKGDGPLTVAVAGYEKNSNTLAIAPTSFGVWYSYKIVYDNTQNTPKVKYIYRKETAGNNWILLTKAPNENELTGYDWWEADYNSSRAANTVKIFAYNNQSNADVQNATIPTSWTFKNLQITDGNAFTGAATVSGGNLNLALNTELWSAADVIVAVYDGTKLANVSYAPVAITGNTANITVPYTAGNRVLLYAWDSLATGKPVLAEPMTITVTQ